MNRFIQAALGNRVFPNLLMLALLVLGAFGISNLTVKNFPEINTGAVSISVPFPGASPQEVSDSVIEPIENKIRSLDGVRKITATAQQSVGQVTVDVLRSADVSVLRNDIETAISEITVFPDAAEEPVVTEVDPPELAIQYVFAGDIGAAQLKDVAQTAREGLLAQDGISNVTISGVPADEINVEISRDTLRAYGLSLGQVAEQIAAQNLDLSGGKLQSDDVRLQIRAIGERETGAALAEIPLLSTETGRVLRLGDIAEIDDGLSEDPVAARLDGTPAVYLSVFRSGNEQVLDLVATTRSFMNATFLPTLPSTITAVEWRNEADNLQGRINLLTRNAMIGAALIIILLTLFLDLRIAFWVSAGIAISFVGAFGLMLMFGLTINQLSLFGFILALGIVVDDAIVVGESIYARRTARDDGRTAAITGATRMSAPVFFAVATTIAAFVPLLFLPGTSGSFIAPVAAVVIMVLSVSLLESFFILPQHLSHLGTDAPRKYSPRRLTDALRNSVGARLDRFSDGPVRNMAGFSARQPLFVILTSVGILVASIGLLTGGFVRFVFFPEIEGNFIAATVELPSGTSQVRTLEVAERLSEAGDRAAETLARDLGVEADQIIQASAIAVGFSAAGGDPDGGGGGSPSRATVDIKIEDAETRSFAAARFEDLWRDEMDEVAGARELSFSASLVGVGAPVSLQISAADDASRADALARIEEALQGRDGVYAIRNSDATAAQEVQIRRSDEAEALDVPLAQIAQAVRSAVFGEVATELIRSREEVEVRVRLPRSERNTLADLSDLRIPVDDALVPLSTLAELELAPAPTTITRIGARQVTTIEADVDANVTSGGAETGFVTSEVLPDIRETAPDVQIELSGEQEEQQRFGAALGQNFSLAVFAMFAILALAFQSFTKPLLMLLTVPFGLFGALVGHALLGLNLTLLSMFGIIGLSGVLINASLLILNEIEMRKADSDGDADIIDIIADGTAARFRPIFLTTLTTFLGITPLILEQSLQAQFLIPTAVSLGFGVLFGAVFVLVVMPAFVSIHHGLTQRFSELRTSR